ncbi:hypothetical protein MUK42_01417, partial [Musa troglodytarum]
WRLVSVLFLFPGKDGCKERRRLPRESPTWNRLFSAHWLRESVVLGGTLHALSLPPTKKSLASELPKMLARRRARQKGDKDSDEAMENNRERERGWFCWEAG